jgi:hypothetical protein
MKSTEMRVAGASTRARESTLCSDERNSSDVRAIVLSVVQRLQRCGNSAAACGECLARFAVQRDHALLNAIDSYNGQPVVRLAAPKPLGSVIAAWRLHSVRRENFNRIAGRGSA